MTCLARSGSTLYVGGFFRSVGENSGGLVPLDAETAEPVSGFPKVDGAVYSLIADGAGGWSVGGNFTSVNGVPRHCLARILRDGTVSSWDAGLWEMNGWKDGPYVMALALANGRLYAAGDFGGVHGHPRMNLACLDAADGTVLDWNPGTNLDGEVYTLAIRDSAVFIGGFFDTLGTQERWGLGAVDGITGEILPWSAQTAGTVHSLLLHGDTLYAGGAFAAYGDTVHSLLAAFDVHTAALLPFNPRLDGMWVDYAPQPCVRAISIVHDTLWIAGNFTTVGGDQRNSIAALDLASGRLLDWTPPELGVRPPGFPPMLCTWLAVHRGRVFVAGWFESVAGEARRYLTALDLTTGQLTDWDPKPQGPVDASMICGDSILVGGEFSMVGGWQHRAGLAAIDLRSGRAKPWNPNQDGHGIVSMIIHGDRLYVSGDFSSIGGQPRVGLAAVDTLNGEAADWNPGTDGYVESWLALRDTLFVGGNFTQVAGFPRNNLAALDAKTGAVTDWNPDADWPAFSLAGAESTIYVGGLFQQIGGTPRASLAAVHARTGEVLPWNPQVNGGWVSALLVSGDRVFAGGTFGQIGGLPRSGLAALDRVTGNPTAWNPAPGPWDLASPEVKCLALADSTLFVGGDFSGIGGQPSTCLAAVDTTSGMARDWTPDPDGYVWSLLGSESALDVGGGFARMANLPCSGLGEFTLPSLPTRHVDHTLSFRILPNPSFEGAVARFALPVSGPVRLDLYDVQGRRVAPLIDDSRSAGAYDSVLPTERLACGVYLCRLVACHQTLVRKLVVLRTR